MSSNDGLIRCPNPFCTYQRPANSNARLWTHIARNPRCERYLYSPSGENTCQATNNNAPPSADDSDDDFNIDIPDAVECLPERAESPSGVGNLRRSGRNQQVVTQLQTDSEDILSDDEYFDHLDALVSNPSESTHMDLPHSTMVDKNGSHPTINLDTDVSQGSPTNPAPSAQPTQKTTADGRVFNLGVSHPIGTNESFEALNPQSIPPSLYGMVEILHITRKAGAPLNLVDQLFEIIEREVKLRRFDPYNLPRTRSSLKRTTRLFHCPTPNVVSIPMERSKKEIAADIIAKSPSFPVYNFVQQLQDLLNDEAFSDLDNLVINRSNPWGPYTRGSSTFVDANDDTIYAEVHDGTWYQNICKDNVNWHEEFVLGLHFNVDKTGATGNAFQRHSSEPFMFTLSIFTEECKHKPHLWRPLGFIPPADKKAGSSGRKVRNYHRILDAMFAGIVEAQRKPPLVRIRLGNEFRYLLARIYLVNCICDGLANEVLVGRIQNRQANCPRLCRACHTRTADSSSPNSCCQYISQYAMEKLTIAALGPSPQEEPSKFQMFLEEEFRLKRDRGKMAKLLGHRKRICSRVLKEVFSSHVVDNAFFKLDMGPNPAGIFGGTPTDLMHAVEEGFIPCLLSVIVDPMTDTQKEVLNSIASSMFQRNNCPASRRQDYPRTSFSGDFTSLTLLSADEKVGKLLLLYLVCITKQGQKVLNDRCNHDFDEKRKKNREKFTGPQPEMAEEEGYVSSDGHSVGDTPISKIDYDEYCNEQTEFITDQFESLDLQFLQSWENHIDEKHWHRICQIIWEVRRSSTCKEGNQIVCKENDVSLPFTGICDRREVLYSRPLSNKPADSPYCAQELLISRRDLLPNEECQISIESKQSRNCRPILELMAMVLSFHAYYKYRPDSASDSTQSLQLIRQLMSLVKTQVNRGPGTMNWDISKFHELLHLVRDSVHFGSARTYDTTKTEYGLQNWSKLPSRTVARRGEEMYNIRIACRLTENSSIAKACNQLHGGKLSCEEKTASSSNPGEPSPRLSKANIRVFACEGTDEDTFCLGYERIMNSSHKRHQNQNQHIPHEHLAWLERQGLVEPGTIIYSEIFLKDGTLLRATSNYLGDGPWYDWVTVLQDMGNQKQSECPFLIYGFLEKEDKSTGMKTIIGYGRESSSMRPNRKGILANVWKMKRTLKELDLETIERGPVFAFHLPMVAEQENPVIPGSMASWVENQDLVEACDLMEDWCVLVTDRKEEWPQTFLHNNWRQPTSPCYNTDDVVSDNECSTNKPRKRKKKGK